MPRVAIDRDRNAEKKKKKDDAMSKRCDGKHCGPFLNKLLSFAEGLVTCT